MIQNMSELVMALAFVIEDPCGAEDIGLSRALVELGQVVPEKHRLTMIGLLQRWTRSFSEPDETASLSPHPTTYQTRNGRVALFVRLDGELEVVPNDDFYGGELAPDDAKSLARAILERAKP
jgi:hypothetical protein